MLSPEQFHLHGVSLKEIITHMHLMISFYISASKSCHDNIKICINPLTNINFVGCQFNNNTVSELMHVNAVHCKAKLDYWSFSFYQYYVHIQYIARKKE